MDANAEALASLLEIQGEQILADGESLSAIVVSMELQKGRPVPGGKMTLVSGVITVDADTWAAKGGHQGSKVTVRGVDAVVVSESPVSGPYLELQLGSVNRTTPLSPR